MHYLNDAHSDLFIINKAHLSERLKDFEQPAPKMKTACPDSSHMPLPPFLVLASGWAERHAGNDSRQDTQLPPDPWLGLCDPMGVTSPY